MAKGIKAEIYSEEQQEIDIEEFKYNFQESLEDIEDPRKADNQKYLFQSLMGIILCAVVAGSNTISDIHQYAVSKKVWLDQWLDLEKGVPSYMAFWWLLVRLNPKETEGLFRKWIGSLKPTELKEVIAIDGKRVRGASRKGRSESLLHMVSAWSSIRGLILGQVKTNEKSNEITAIPELLDVLDIFGAVITSDAMGCQKEIASKIVSKGGDYTIALKGNQQSLCDEVANFFEQAYDVGFEGVDHTHERSIEKGHGRIEERDVYATSDIDWLPMKNEWANLQSIAMVKSKRTIGDKSADEVRYYVSSLEPNAKELARVIRSHWGIENSVHWVLDVTFEEDDSMVLTGNAGENLSILRRLTLNMLRLDPDKKCSLKVKRKKAGWNDDYLAYLLGLSAVNCF